MGYGGGGAQNTPIYVICSAGGTLETAAERKARSAQRACARAIAAAANARVHARARLERAATMLR